MFPRFCRYITLIAFFVFSFGPAPQVQAQDLVPFLPKPGEMLALSSAYQPALIRGITVHKDNPFRFDFIVDLGQEKLKGQALKDEGEKLIKYFLATLAIPQNDLWVNLSPYEKDRIIPEVLGETDMGRDLLAQDYILKQMTASLIYPESRLGKDFWDRIYAKEQKLYGRTRNIPVSTFNKVWIVADKAEVYVRGQSAYVLSCHLKVMLEEDYLALQKHSFKDTPTHSLDSLEADITRDLILPELEKEVNKGKNFASLRQICNSIILANWYKNNLKESLLNQAYSDKSNIKGIDLADKNIKMRIYQRYLQAYRKGVFNFVKDDLLSAGVLVPRKYFSGGFANSKALSNPTVITKDLSQQAMAASPGELERFSVRFTDGQEPRVYDAAMLETRAMPLGDEPFFGPIGRKAVERLFNALKGKTLDFVEDPVIDLLLKRGHYYHTFRGTPEKKQREDTLTIRRVHYMSRRIPTVRSRLEYLSWNLQEFQQMFEEMTFNLENRDLANTLYLYLEYRYSSLRSIEHQEDELKAVMLRQIKDYEMIPLAKEAFKKYKGRTLDLGSDPVVARLIYERRFDMTQQHQPVEENSRIPSAQIRIRYQDEQGPGYVIWSEMDFYRFIAAVSQFNDFYADSLIYKMNEDAEGFAEFIHEQLDRHTRYSWMKELIPRIDRLFQEGAERGQEVAIRSQGLQDNIQLGIHFAGSQGSSITVVYPNGQRQGLSSEALHWVVINMLTEDETKDGPRALEEVVGLFPQESSGMPEEVERPLREHVLKQADNTAYQAQLLEELKAERDRWRYKAAGGLVKARGMAPWLLDHMTVIPVEKELFFLNQEISRLEKELGDYVYHRPEETNQQVDAILYWRQENDRQAGQPIQRYLRQIIASQEEQLIEHLKNKDVEKETVPALVRLSSPVELEAFIEAQKQELPLDDGYQAYVTELQDSFLTRLLFTVFLKHKWGEYEHSHKTGQYTLYIKQLAAWIRLRQEIERAFKGKPNPAMASPEGGIDLRHYVTHVRGDTSQMGMDVDQAMIDRVKHKGIESLTPEIFSISPLGSFENPHS